LGAITIPSGVISIGKDAFQSTALTSVTLPEGIVSIKKGAFGFCKQLTSVTLSKGLTEIAEEAFMGCTALTSVTFPDTLTSIGESAFSRCKSISSIVIPYQVTNIGMSAFDDCIALTSVTVKPTTPPNIPDNEFIIFSYCKGNPDGEGCHWERLSDVLRIYVPQASVEAYKKAKGWRHYAERIAAIP